MRQQRILLGLVIGFAVLGAAWSQGGELRWRESASPLGLQLSTENWRGPCGSIAFPCDAGTNVVRLYATETAHRSLSLQISVPEDVAALRLPRSPGLNASLVGRADIAPRLGVYGRIGTRAARAGLAGLPGGEGGLTYGVGLSWDFSRRGSAVVGWDLYDFRTLGGEARDVRATSLGLQWRY